MISQSREWENLAEDVKATIIAYQQDFPVRIGDLIKQFNVELKVSTLDVGISGMIFPFEGGYKILVNKHEPAYRRRFTAAHELSHFLLHRDVIGSGISDNVLYRSTLSDSMEAEANRLASDILMPLAAVKSARKDLMVAKIADAVSPLAAMFAVSEEAMRIRLGLK
jgi:Zn-dependent peptidase ImmA (M78 family)